MGTASFIAAMTADEKVRAAQRSPSEKRRFLYLSAADHDALTRTLWGECRGQSNEGIMTVAHVIFNRVCSSDPLFKHDDTVEHACKRAHQFSCWKDLRTWKLPVASAEYKNLYYIAGCAARDYRLGYDYAHGATSYETEGAHASWAQKLRVLFRRAGLNFYRNKEKHT